MKKVLAWAVVLALVLSSFTMAFADQTKTSADFKDASQIQYTEAVDVMVALGVINGFPDGTFGPQKTVTRGQMAKMIAVIMNSGEDVGDQYKSACPFADSKSHWAAGYIAYCASEHIIDGRSADVFDPDADVTGTEVAKMALTSLGYDSKIQGYTGETWAANVLKDAKKNNLFKGLDKSFVPGDPCSREAAAQILFNMLKAVMVQYNNNTSISVGDNTQVVVSSKAEQIENPGDGNDNMLNLYEEVFGESSDATLVDKAEGKDGKDEFGRNGHTWYVEGDKVGTYTASADYEFTAEKETVTEAIKAYDEDLAEDLAKLTPSYVLNGDDVKAEAIGLGDTIELYVSDNAYKAIIIQYKPYQITDVNTNVKKADADKGVAAYVTIAGLGKYNDTDIAGYDANSFTKEAVIAVAANKDKEILDAYVMDELANGEITKINNTSKAVTIDGKAYDKATNYAPLDEAPLAVEGEFALYDYNGYYLASLNTKEAASEVVYYGVIVDTGVDTTSPEWDSEGAAVSRDKYKIFTTEGKAETLVVAKDKTIAKTAKNTLVKYTLNDDGDIATMEAAQSQWNSQKMDGNGVIQGKAVSEDVVVFFNKAKATEDPDYTTYKYSDLEGADSISAYYFMEDGEAVVALLTAPIESTETIFGFVADVDENTVSGGTQATVKAFVNGKEVTYTTVIDESKTADHEYTIESAGIDELMIFTLNGDGALEKAEKANPAPVNDIQTVFPQNAKAVKMDVRVDGKNKKGDSLDIDSTADFNYQSVAGADFYLINEDGKMEVSSASAIKAGDMAKLFQTDASSSSWNIVVFKSVPELDVVGAPMVDADTGTAYDTPAVSYKDGVITITAKNVPFHTAGNGVDAYWVGVGIKHAESYEWGFVGRDASAEPTSSFDVEGTTYDTFYFGTLSSFDGKTGFIKVNGNEYKVDFSGVSYGEKPAPEETPAV